MKYLSVNSLKTPDFSSISTEYLADYAYALSCLKFPASVAGGGKWQQTLASSCDRLAGKLRNEIGKRLKTTPGLSSLTNALKIIEGKESPAKDAEAEELFHTFVNSRNLTELTTSELVRLHSVSRLWYDMRRRNRMEAYTRAYQWMIVEEMMRRPEDESLAGIFFLSECLEAFNYSYAINMPYTPGEQPATFDSSDYRSDDALVAHIEMLAKKQTWIAREELVEIADHILHYVVETGNTSEHLSLVNAILNTGMPQFNYPEIVKALEKTTAQLAKSNSKSRLELASSYNTLWLHTLKSSYLSKFESTLRHCYFTLANGKTYPGLGIDKEDPRSLTSALNLLDKNRRTLNILSDRYDVDKVIHRYQPCLQ